MSPMEKVVTLELLRVEPLVLDVVLPTGEDVLVLGVLRVTQLSRPVSDDFQRGLGVDDVLHLLVGVVEGEEGEPNLLALDWAHPVGLWLGSQVVVVQSAVRPLQADGQLGLVRRVDGVEGVEGVEPDGDHDGETDLVRQADHWRREELVVAGVELYHPAVNLVREVLAVSLAVTPEDDREGCDQPGCWCSDLFSRLMQSPSLQVNW